MRSEDVIEQLSGVSVTVPIHHIAQELLQFHQTVSGVYSAAE